MLTFEDALDTADALEERIAASRDDAQRAELREKKAMVDFTAFGLFKQAGVGQALGDLAKPLAWGVGLGLPALGVGHALLSDAESKSKKVINHARNQALLSALGIGGMQAVGSGIQGLMGKMGSDNALLNKLAAYVVLDDVLETQYGAAEHPREKLAIAECLMINRIEGAALLRNLLR